MDDIVKDKRFAHIAKDPRFRRMPRNERKVKIDSRFKEMFTNDKFSLKCSVDKRGRPIKQSTSENLKRFYDISDDESSESDSDSDKDSTEEISEKVDSKDETDASDSSDEEKTEKQSKQQKIKETKKKKKMEKPEIKNPRLTNIKDEENEEEEEEDEPVETSNKKKVNKQNKLNVKGDDKKQKKDKENKKKKKKGSKSVEESSDSDSSIDKNELFSKGDIDFARGEAEFSSSSEEEDDLEEDEGLIHNWAEMDENVQEVQEPTSRIAICNLDWDRINSKDIFTALNSFKPNDGFVKSVKIYMSEYGKERMEQERAEGPKELKAIKHDEEEDDALLEDKLIKESFTENLRKYQFNRLRYYYGVVECDSVETADHLYKECDGNEYETSCTKFDLRFIPEDMEFDDSDKKSECGEVPHGYEPDLFKNYAMAFSKAELTWDETDRTRQNLVSKQFTAEAVDLKEDDLKAYLAESSDEEGADYSKLLEQSGSESDSEERETEDKQIDKYKRLLLELDKDEKEKIKGDVQMEITWEMGLKETTEELVKKKSQSSDKTVWDQYLDKKKQKKKEKRKDKKKKKKEESSDDEDEEEKQEGEFEAFSDDDVPADLGDDPFFADEMDNVESTNKKDKDKKKKKKKDKKKENTEEDENEKAALSLLMMDEDDNRKHFNLKKIIEEDNPEGKRKKKKKMKKNKGEVKQQEEDDFQLNVQDPRFSAVYESHLYNIDPSAPEYKKTKGSEALVTEKLKRSADPKSKKRANKDRLDDSAKKIKLDSSGRQKDDSLASLVKSVKAKTKSFQSSKSHKER